MIRAFTPAIPVIACLATIICVAGAVPACAASVDDWCVELRLCDPPAPDTVTIDILCDRTADCTVENLRLTLEESLRFCATRPGSIVRLWMMGRYVTDVTIIATAENLSEDTRGKKKKASSAQRFVDRELPRMVAAAQLSMSTPAPAGSPIAEALTVVSWAEARTTTRKIIVVTDGRQVSSMGDFECKPLPDEDTWLRSLTTHRSLAPRSLESVAVHFAFVGVAAVAGRGCRVSLERETEIRELWRAAIARAGGTLDITAGPARLVGVPEGGAK